MARPRSCARLTTASRMVASGRSTRPGGSITSCTRSSSRRPRLPPGCRSANCSRLKPSLPAAPPPARHRAPAPPSCWRWGRGRGDRLLPPRAIECHRRHPGQQRIHGPGDGDDRDVEPLQRSHQAEQVLRFPTLTQHDGDVVRPHDAQVAVQRIDRMEIGSSGAGRGQRGGQLPGDEPRFPHPGHDDPSLDVGQQSHRPGKLAAHPALGLRDRPGLELKHPAPRRD